MNFTIGRFYGSMALKRSQGGGLHVWNHAGYPYPGRREMCIRDRVMTIVRAPAMKISADTVTCLLYTSR